MMYDEETLRNLLKTHFGWHTFRQRQVEAIQAVLSGENVFVRSATGSGKSLTWQLPALARAHIAGEGEKKLIVVIYPTKSLLMDQAAKLHGLDLKFVCCHGDQAFKATQKALDQLEATSKNMPDILLTIPEYLASLYSPLCVLLYRLHQADKLGLIVIDEAQQVLQWGTNFRPPYMDFASVISEHFPNVPRLALSAAITKKNLLETAKILGMEKHVSISETLDHPNVYYEVRRKETIHIPIYGPHIRDLLRKGQGIIYCTTRNDTILLTTTLSQAGIRADCYNAGLAAGLRETAATKWANGEIDVLVATSAFMFGIDNPNVRWVVWDSFPSSIENWVQGSGRAGRDGEKAWSVIYYKPTDEAALKNLHAEDNPKPETEALSKLTEILNDSVSCRRYKILSYFGEECPNYRCNNCDNCTSTSFVGFHNIEHDLTKDAQDIVRLLQKMTTRSSRRETRHAFIETILRKKPCDGIPDLPLQIRLPTGRPSQLQHIALLLSNLIRENIILEENKRCNNQRKTSYLMLGPKAGDLLDGSLKVMVCYPAAEEPTVKGSNPKKQETNRRRNVKFRTRTGLKTIREIIDGREVDCIVLD